MKMHSISQKLFRTYAGCFAAYLLILSCVCITYMAYGVKKNVWDAQEQLMKSMDENVQNYFQRMNEFSLELINSKEFKKISIRQLPQEFEDGRSTSELFSRLYVDAYKMIPLKYHVGIVVDDKYYLWMGGDYYISRIGEEHIPTYDHMVRNEMPVIRYQEENAYLKQTSLRADTYGPYITLARSMDNRNRYMNGRAILEVHIKKAVFENEMAKISGKESGAGLKIDIYDADGNVLYKESNQEFSRYIKSGELENYQRKGDFVASRKIFGNNLILVYTRDAEAYQQKMLEFWGISLSLCALVIGITFFVTYKISKQISNPIHEICDHTRRINLTEGRGFEEITTDIGELQFLSGSLKQMSLQIEDSIEQIITLKNYEMQAQMLALQSQMQPHFLFNTLSNIASMADEEGNDRIYRICMNLNSMFRYIAAAENHGVMIFEELKHIESYVEIMKERFPESEVIIDVPLEMMDCRIPKLSIQPLVENAFKYCNREKPKIQVKGILESSGKWTIEVRDNGKGFSLEKKEEILQKCREGMKREKSLSNSIDGMGLVNVYVRMKLFYGEDMFYSIQENEGSIIIGGIRDGKSRQL